MATPEQIPTDLTLEIDGNLSPDQFIMAARAFFGYVQEVSKTISADGPTIDWVVRVKEGSQLIGVDPGPNAHVVTVRAVYASIKMGVSKLADGTIGDDNFSETAIKHLKTLTDIAARSNDRTTPIRLWVQKHPTFLGSKIADTIREDWRGNYKDFGSLEGRLEVIQDRGRIQLRLRDYFFEQNVKCTIPEGMLEKAFQFFRQRVEVYGLIHYRKTGNPINIEVKTIDRLEGDVDLPTLDDVRGLLRPEA